jgi:hypothetical protein
MRTRRGEEDKRLALANDLIDFSAYNYYSIMTIVFVL